MHTPENGNLKRTQSMGSMGSTVKTVKGMITPLLKNEQDYNLVGHFRNMETQQLDQYKKSRKAQVQMMLKSN
jgi:hypothetical protein